MHKNFEGYMQRKVNNHLFLLSSSKTYHVNASILNVRRSPYLYSDIIDKISKYRKLNKVTFYTNGWALIIYENYTQSGYVRKEYISY